MFVVEIVINLPFFLHDFHLYIKDIRAKIRRLPHPQISLKSTINSDITHFHNFSNRINHQIILALNQNLSFLQLIINNTQYQILNKIMFLIQKYWIIKEYLFKIMICLLCELFD